MSRQIIHYKSMISWSPQTIVISFLFIACQSKSENNLIDHQTSVDIPIKDSLNRPNDMAVSALDMTISALDMSDDSLTRPNDMTVSALDMTISSLDMTTSALDMSREEDMSTTQLPTPLARWKFDRNEPSPLLSTGEIEGLTFMLNGGASLDDNGLNLMSNPPDAVSTNAFLAGDTSALFARITETNTFSIRLWVWTKHPLQDGPARIFTWSQDSGFRNLTIGQVSSGKVNVRVRFDNGFTNENGLVPVPSEDCPTCVEQVIGSEADSLNPESGFQQVVMQYDALGTVELWVDGVVADRSCVVDDVPGGFSTWDPSFGIALGDELFNSQPRIDTPESANHNRPWAGVIHSLEIYADPLEESQIREWLLEKPTFQASEAEEPSDCPIASDINNARFLCRSAFDESRGLFCEYFVASPSGERLNCQQFCSEINLFACDEMNTCCSNNSTSSTCDSVDFSEQDIEESLTCTAPEGFETLLCRCFARSQMR